MTDSRAWSNIPDIILTRVYKEIVLEIEPLVSVNSKRTDSLKFETRSGLLLDFKVFENAVTCHSETEIGAPFGNKFYYVKNDRFSKAQQVMKRLRNCFAHGNFLFSANQQLDLRDKSIAPTSQGLNTMRSTLHVEDLFSLVCHLKTLELLHK